VRHFGHQPIATPATAVQARHIGLGPSLVDEDQAPGINSPLILLPLRPPARHVRAILLGGVQAFFERQALGPNHFRKSAARLDT
jgi:hypothetical protein